MHRHLNINGHATVRDPVFCVCNDHQKDGHSSLAFPDLEVASNNGSQEMLTKQHEVDGEHKKSPGLENRRWPLVQATLHTLLIWVPGRGCLGRLRAQAWTVCCCLSARLRVVWQAARRCVAGWPVSVVLVMCGCVIISSCDHGQLLSAGRKAVARGP